ncbi:MAG: zinc-dependent metalloprotease [Actinobacteria bacterium]|nr:zinc-dependent metalloprotease [Actinomycetota bacterium]
MTGSGNDPFGGMPFLGDLARMVQGQGPIAWDAARHLAHVIASDGASEANVDPLARIELEQLARVAEVHVASVTGLGTSSTGRPVTVVPVTRTEWVARTLDAWRPLFERLAASLGPGAPAAGSAGTGADSGTGTGTGGADHPAAADPTLPAEFDDDETAAWLGSLMQALAPMMLGMAAGSMVGHLAQRSLGQYDLPIPRPRGDELMVVAPTLDAFGDEWTLPRDDLRLWICLHEIAHHTVLGVPHVRARLDELVAGFVAGFRPDPRGLEDRLGAIDPTAGGVADIQRMFSDPEVLLGAVRSPDQEALQPRLDALVAVVVGYVDHVMDRIGTNLIPSYGRVTEALRRRRVQAADADRFVERLFGLELTTRCYDRGSAFVDGVVERAGDPALDRLWIDPAALPTPAEVDAPGLWLARIDLPGN